MQKTKINNYPNPNFSQIWNQKRVVCSEDTPYNSPGLDCSADPGKTDQSQALDCDVNRILDRFSKTGVLPGVNTESVYADVSDAPTYQEALHIVMNAEKQFNSLDAKTRKKFDNDPLSFLQFVEDPKNLQELSKMGLATISPQTDADRIVEAIRASNTPSPADPDPAGGQPAPKTPKKAKA